LHSRSLPQRSHGAHAAVRSMTANVAPCGSSQTAIRSPPGGSIEATTTPPPARTAPRAGSSAGTRRCEAGTGRSASSAWEHLVLLRKSSDRCKVGATSGQRRPSAEGASARKRIATLAIRAPPQTLCGPGAPRALLEAAFLVVRVQDLAAAFLAVRVHGRHDGGRRAMRGRAPIHARAKPSREPGSSPASARTSSPAAAVVGCIHDT
jgi:hypothetical protein